jgi:nickel-dependent lactate racemase
VEWQRGPQTITLPDDNLTIIERPDLPSLGTPVELVERALAEPIGCPPLEEMVRPGDHVALLITDTQDRVFGQEGVGVYLLDRLNRAGIPDRDITLIHAAGMHGHAQARQKLGEALLERVSYVEHDPMDPRENRFLGVTFAGTPVWVNRRVADADFVMGVGHCGPSLYGFQGGAGIICPGVSSKHTVRHNHARIMTTRTSSAWGPGNPMREDVMNIGDLARLRLKIDFTGNTVFAGYFREEWPVAVKYVERHMMVPTEPADLYVFAPGSQRRLMSLYMQIEAAETVTHEESVVIAVIGASGYRPLSGRPLEETLREFEYCTEQWTKATGEVGPLNAYWHERDEVCKTELLAHPLEEISLVVTRMLGEPRSTTHVWSHRRCIERRRVILVSEGVSPEDGLKMGFKAVTNSFEEALGQAKALLPAKPRIVANMAPKNGVPILASAGGD